MQYQLYCSKFKAFNNEIEERIKKDLVQRTKALIDNQLGDLEVSVEYNTFDIHWLSDGDKFNTDYNWECAFDSSDRHYNNCDIMLLDEEFRG